MKSRVKSGEANGNHPLNINAEQSNKSTPMGVDVQLIHER